MRSKRSGTKPKKRAKVKKAKPAEPIVAPKQTWSDAELESVKHLGPGVLGEELHQAVQAYNTRPTIPNPAVPPVTEQPANGKKTDR